MVARTLVRNFEMAPWKDFYETFGFKTIGGGAINSNL